MILLLKLTPVVIWLGAIVFAVCWNVWYGGPWDGQVRRRRETPQEMRARYQARLDEHERKAQTKVRRGW